MMKRLHSFFEDNWVVMLFVPPFVIAVCYFLYGDAYFSSWQNFGRMTYPWFFQIIFTNIGVRWVVRTMQQRFKKLEEWPMRVVGTLLGQLFFVVGFVILTYLILCASNFANLVPTERKFYIVVILATMSVLITGTVQEGANYFGKWKEAISETEQLEKLTLESQFRSLQSQLNPHFLFNSFNVLSSLITENPRRAEDFVDELSNVYRYLLRSNEHELASVGEELRFIRSYFHLLETRHDTGISLKINVQKENLDKKIPTLALQILVENAVKHNEISPEKPLHIEIMDSRSTLLVRNNMQQKATRPPSNRVGLDNLRQRYELFGVADFEVADDGRFFKVSLPVLD